MASPLTEGKGRFLLLLLPALLPVPVWAETGQAEAPSPELLEFLGSWEADDGQWLDPLDLLAEIDADAKATNDEKATLETKKAEERGDE
jgi:hypothetical protein